MKVSPLATANKYSILTTEETENDILRPVKPWKVACCAIHFISKLHNLVRQAHNSKINPTPKLRKFFIRSAYLAHEVMLKIGLKTIDTHAFLNLVALLDCGATGLFIDRAYVRRNNIATRKLEHPVPVYNIDGMENVGGSITEEVTMMMTYQGHQEHSV